VIIKVHIEKLILDGITVDANDRTHLKTSIEAGLAELIGANSLRGDLLTGGALRSLNGGEIHLTSGTTPALMGGAIARAVGTSITTPEMTKSSRSTAKTSTATGK